MWYNTGEQVPRETGSPKRQGNDQIHVWLFPEAEKKLMEREKAVLHRELRADALERLKEDDLPAKLADLINCENVEDFSRTYKTVVEAFKEAVTTVPKSPNAAAHPNRHSRAQTGSGRHSARKSERMIRDGKYQFNNCISAVYR